MLIKVITLASSVNVTREDITSIESTIMATQSINGSSANGGSSGGGGVGTIPVDVALTELNETVSRLASHKGVETVQILNRDGDIITESSSNPAASITVSEVTSASSTTTTPTTNQATTTTATTNGNDATQSAPTTAAGDSPVAQQTFLTKQAALTKKIMDLAGQYLHNVDGDDEVSFIQIRSKSGQELLIAPHEGYVLAVHKR